MVLCVKWNENGNWVLTASKDQIIKVDNMFLTLKLSVKLIGPILFVTFLFLFFIAILFNHFSSLSLSLSLSLSHNDVIAFAFVAL